MKCQSAIDNYLNQYKTELIGLESTEAFWSTIYCKYQSNLLIVSILIGLSVSLLCFAKGVFAKTSPAEYVFSLLVCVSNLNTFFKVF